MEKEREKKDKIKDPTTAIESKDIQLGTIEEHSLNDSDTEVPNKTLFKRLTRRRAKSEDIVPLQRKDSDLKVGARKSLRRKTFSVMKSSYSVLDDNEVERSKACVIQ